MMTKNRPSGQGNLFREALRDLVDPKHPLVLLADAIDWKSFEDGLQDYFCADNGRPSCPVRLMVGLHYLKFAFGYSDEATIAEWRENIYWQYFTGGEFFEHAAPTDQSTMSRWRSLLAKSGAEAMLSESIKTGLREGLIKKKELTRVNVDSTVQEKNVRFPTDARLYDRMREWLVRSAAKHGITLRETYVRVGKKLLRKQSGYAKAKQFKRARAMTKKLKTILGRVQRELARKISSPDAELQELLQLAQRLLLQRRNDKHKLYSVHEPQVECISKGKAHKQYEFGTKVGLVTAAKTNWIVGAEAYPGNPYDGHTLKSALAQATKIIGSEPTMAICDLGYRGHNYEGDCDVQVVNRFRKRKSRSLCRWWNRRSAIEPIIGHLKSDHRMARNYLRGKLGDELNVIFAAAGFNFRKLYRAFALFLRLLLGLWISRKDVILTLREAHSRTERRQKLETLAA